MDEPAPVILIVEDDMGLARFNARILKRRGYAVIVANSAASARRAVTDKNPDLLIMDVTLPDGDGRSLCEEFRQFTDAPVLFLTGLSETADKLKGFDSGGDYYLTKPYDLNEMTAVVGSMLRRARQAKKMVAEASFITRGPITLNLPESRALVNGRDAELTPKEFAVLLMLAQNEGKELTSERIYSGVWGATMNNDPNAVRLQISRLKKKLGEEDQDGFAIFTEYGKGYTFTTFGE